MNIEKFVSRLKKVASVLVVGGLVTACDSPPQEWWIGRYNAVDNKGNKTGVIFEDSGPLSERQPTCPPTSAKLIGDGTKITGTLEMRSTIFGPQPDCDTFIPDYSQPEPVATVAVQ